MKRISPIVLAILAIAMHTLAAGSNYAVQWEKGNNFYQQKQFDSALYYFEQIAALKPENAEVYYNIGNTYYRLNKMPNAILNYERALKFNPHYKEAKENLALAQARISGHVAAQNEIFFIRWWNGITEAEKATAWSVSAAVVFCLIIVTMLFRRLNPRSIRILPVQFLGILWAICLSFLVLAYCSSINKLRNDGAVVMVNDAPMMNDHLSGKPVTLVPEGTAITILSQRDNWTEIRLPDGRTGWLQQNLLEKI